MSHNPQSNEIISDRAPEPVGAFPHAKRVGHLLFLSGIGPRKRGSKDIPGVTLDAAGQITMPVADVADDVVVGLPYDTDLEILPTLASNPDGPVWGKSHRIDGASVVVDRTIGGQVGPDAEHLQLLPHPQALLDGRPILFSGIHEVDSLDTDWSREEGLLIRQSQPYPLTVVAILPQLRTSDR